jgi:ABC-type antimicrobial peptide transport system permease subunit
MMMAVTERFREIATMKCLGAVDGFILKAFLIESGSVGLVGAFVGAVIGIILVLLQSTARFGGTFWAALPAGNLFVATAAALLCGLILTILGALLPAYRAARMHPIEAMRLEA